MPKILGSDYLYSQPLYDTMQLAAVAGEVKYSFFTIPYNGVLTAAANKGWQHTNIVQNSMLEKGNNFVMKGISLYVRETASGGVAATLADVKVLQEGYLELLLGQVTYLKVPTALIPSGGAELNYFSNIAAAATEYHVNRGVSAFSNRYHLESPIEVEEQEAIAVDLVIPGTIAAVTDVTIVLWGTLTRPVR